MRYSKTTYRTLVAAILMIALCEVLASCGSSKTIATSTSQSGKKYERKAIVETTDERLKCEAMIIDATMRQELGRDEEAERLFHAVLKTEPNNDAACYELSQMYAAKGMIDSAITFGVKAAEIDGKNVWYLLNLAYLYKKTNKVDEHIATWENITASHPEVIEYYYELSNAYLQKGDIKGAIGSLNRVEKKVGITSAVSLQKAKLWNHIGKKDKALQEIEALSKTMPQESRYNAILAEQYMSAGNYTKAKECYDRILASNPDDEYVHISLAEYYKATKQPRKAYEELKIAMRQSNLSTTNKMQLLTSFYSSEEFYGIYSQYGYDLLETAMQSCDDSTSYAAFYGDVLMRQGKNGEAINWFKKALSVDSSDHSVWEALLICEISTNADTAVLRNHASRALSLFPLQQMPYYSLAIVEHIEGNYAEAIKLMKQCESLGFDKGFLEPETYDMLAECYNRTDDTLCYQYYEKYLKLRPDDPDALNSYAYRLAVDNRNLKKAEAMSKKTLNTNPDNPYYLDTYAWILHQMGRDEEALKYIKRAMQRDEESDEVRQHYEAIMQKIKK